MKIHSLVAPLLAGSVLTLLPTGYARAQAPASPAPSTAPKTAAAPAAISPAPSAAPSASPALPDMAPAIPRGFKVEPVSPEILERYDKNHNGVLDPDEKAAYDRDRMQRRAERLKKYDKNGDGKIDDQERAAMYADLERQKAAAAKASPTP